MPMPTFLRRLRDTIGHSPVLLPAVSMLVTDDRGRLLVMRRADNGRWSLPSGIVEPGEQPARTAEREVLEETGLHVTAERVVGTFATPEMTYPNGDRASYVTILFECRCHGGQLHAADGEALELEFRPLDDLPDMPILEWLPRPVGELLGRRDCAFSRAMD